MPLNWNNTPYQTYHHDEQKHDRELKNAEKLGKILADIENVKKEVETVCRTTKSEASDIKNLLEKNATEIKNLVGSLQEEVDELQEEVEELKSGFKVIVAKAGIYFSIACSALAYGVNFLLDKFKG